MRKILFAGVILWAIPVLAEEKPIVPDDYKIEWYAFNDTYKCIAPCEFYVLEMEIDGAHITLGKGGKIVGPFVAKDKDGKVILSIPAGETMEESK